MRGDKLPHWVWKMQYQQKSADGGVTIRESDIKNSEEIGENQEDIYDVDPEEGNTGTFDWLWKIDKEYLPAWINGLDEFPNWLRFNNSDDVPSWLQEGIIPHDISNHMESGPPRWMLEYKQYHLPIWMNRFEEIPKCLWFENLKDVPLWMLKDNVPSYLRDLMTVGLIPNWMLEIKEDHLPNWMNYMEHIPQWMNFHSIDDIPSWLFRDSLPVCLYSLIDSGLPKWMLEYKEDHLPNWLKSLRDFPDWMKFNSIDDVPPWLLQDVIPSYFTSAAPPKWTLESKNNKLPDWMYDLDKIPEWLMFDSINDVPHWVLRNSIPVCLSDWMKSGPPKWIMKLSHLPLWLEDYEALPNCIKDADAETGPLPWLLEDKVPKWVVEKMSEGDAIELFREQKNNDSRIL